MRIVLTYLSVLCSVLSIGQDYSFSLISSENKLIVGSTAIVTLNIEYNHQNDKRVSWPVITDSTKLGNGVEIWDIQAPEKHTDSDDEGNISKFYSQEFTIACFDTGLVELGPISFFQNDTEFESNKLTLLVEYENTDPNGDLKDIQSIEEDPLSFMENLLLWLREFWYIPLVSLLLIGLIIFLALRKPKEVQKEIAKRKIPLIERLSKQIDTLKSKKLYNQHQYKEHYTGITDIINEFLSEQYKLDVLDKTTPEMLSILQGSTVPTEFKVFLKEFLPKADMVKFAKFKPTPFECEDVLQKIEAIVNTHCKKPNQENTEE